VLDSEELCSMQSLTWLVSSLFCLLSVDFSLYYYTSAEVQETKMVLPVHQATKACFSMTSQKTLQISVSRIIVATFRVPAQSDSFSGLICFCFIVI
jgi:hypothetical protein